MTVDAHVFDNERFKLARIEAQITAEALAGASRERQEALLIQIGKEQRMRLRMFNEVEILRAACCVAGLYGGVCQDELNLLQLPWVVFGCTTTILMD